MSRQLIPTAIVDVNGRLTTVHKRAEGTSRGNSALGNVKPSLGVTVSDMHTIKPKKLPVLSDSVRLAQLFGALITNEEIEAFVSPTGRSTVQMSDDEIYDGLRKGFTIQDAAALKSIGISLDEIMERTKDSYVQGGSLDIAVGRKGIRYRTEISGALERLQASGTSPAEAEKMIINGLQDGHLDRALNDDQIKELFSKWRFRSAVQAYEHGPVELDDVIDGFVSGRLPFDLINHKMANLKNSESELYDLYERKFNRDGRSLYTPDAELAERLSDPDYRVRLVDKAATAMPGEYRPLVALDKLVQGHGMEVLELNDPRMAAMTIYVSPGVNRECGVEAAKYVERVLDLAKEETGGDLWGSSSKRHESQGAVQANGVYLRNWELLDLYERGVPAEESYDLLVKHKLSREQIIVARETGVGSTLASGVL